MSKLSITIQPNMMSTIIYFGFSDRFGGQSFLLTLAFMPMLNGRAVSIINWFMGHSITLYVVNRYIIQCNNCHATDCEPGEQSVWGKYDIKIHCMSTIFVHGFRPYLFIDVGFAGTMLY